ncbi:MAG: T9SS type A sorting domain-containing protein, partial [Chitinophagaceae bacterium]
AVSAQKQNSQVLINWSTASEQNTKDFEVQYSTNTTNWDALANVQAAGNTTSTRNYSFTHQSPLKNNTYNYYRILQRDLDGKFSYSKIVSIVFDEPGPDFLVYPNPADKLATIYLSEASEVSLVNSAGSVVWKSKLPSGRNLLPLEKYSAGVYILRAGKSSQRLVIQ